MFNSPQAVLSCSIMLCCMPLPHTKKYENHAGNAITGQSIGRRAAKLLTVVLEVLPVRDERRQVARKLRLLLVKVSGSDCGHVGFGCGWGCGWWCGWEWGGGGHKGQ